MTARSIESVAAERGAGARDCRDCAHFRPEGDGLGYGWCKAHDQFVKLYHPAGEFFSQCQCKALTRDRPPRAPQLDEPDP